MTAYKYQALDASGAAKVGVIGASSLEQAAGQLRAQGLRISTLAPSRSQDGGESLLEKLNELNHGKPQAKHVLDFTTQLAVMIRAGINLRAALEGISEQTDHPGFKKVVLRMKSDVESGKSFSDALKRYPKLFGPLYVNMVRASEMSGSFSEMLDRIAEYMNQQMETKRMVVGASVYPAVIGTLAVVVTVFLLTFVLPRFYSVFEGKEEVLPWATKFLMGLSQFLVARKFEIVGGIVVFGGLVFAGMKTEPGGQVLDRLKLSIPVIKTMFKALYISRSLQTMGQLINAGVPMLDTLAITGEISGNRLYRSMWGSVHTSVKQGRKVASPLQKTSLLPRAVTQMIGAGEESGKLGEVLDEVSGFYHKKLKDSIKAVTSMIEPVMILLMGSVVGFIAMAIILPIFKMSSVVN
ncbi:MAG: type II secretion system F family protein [Planctomycetota bacterium]